MMGLGKCISFRIWRHFGYLSLKSQGDWVDTPSRFHPAVSEELNKSLYRLTVGWWIIIFCHQVSRWFPIISCGIYLFTELSKCPKIRCSKTCLKSIEKNPAFHRFHAHESNVAPWWHHIALHRPAKSHRNCRSTGKRERFGSNKRCNLNKNSVGGPKKWLRGMVWG